MMFSILCLWTTGPADKFILLFAQSESQAGLQTREHKSTKTITKPYELEFALLSVSRDSPDLVHKKFFLPLNLMGITYGKNFSDCQEVTD